MYTTTIVLKTVSFISSFYILACSYWEDYRIRFCFIPLSSIFPFMNFWTKKRKGSRYDCVSRQDGGCLTKRNGHSYCNIEKTTRLCFYVIYIFPSCTYINYFNNTVKITVLTISAWNCWWRLLYRTLTKTKDKKRVKNVV